MIVWVLSNPPLKHKARLFRGNHSLAPCLGSPCLVSDRTSHWPDKAAHSFDRWPDSLRNLSQLLACLGFSHAGSGMCVLSGRGASVLGQRLSSRRPPSPLGAATPVTVKLPSPSLNFLKRLGIQCAVCGTNKINHFTAVRASLPRFLFSTKFYNIVTSLTQMFEMCMTTSLCCMKADCLNPWFSGTNSMNAVSSPGVNRVCRQRISWPLWRQNIQHMPTSGCSEPGLLHKMLVTYFFAVCFVLFEFFLSGKAGEMKNRYSWEEDVTDWDQCCWGSILKVLILEQVHLLFTVQPAVVNTHVEAVKRKSVKVLFGMCKRSTTKKTCWKYLKPQ